MQFPFVDLELDDQSNEMQEHMATYWKSTGLQRVTPSIRRRINTHTGKPRNGAGAPLLTQHQQYTEQGGSSDQDTAG
eukprot:737169-Hanusia_phi.AAC.1